jgi:ferredoxin
MPGVITDKCIKCKHMDCVAVCPVDAFYEGENMLVINPLECVDCGCCISECPIDAIVFDDDPLAEPWLELNAKYSKLWPNVTYDGGQSPPDAAQFQSVTGKFERYFSPNPGQGDVNAPIRRLRGGTCGHCNEATFFGRMLEAFRRLFN